MKLNRIDRHETGVISEMAMKALEAAFADSNIVITRERGTIGGTFCSLKFQFALKNEATGTVETREATDFKQMAHYYGLKAEDLGRSFQFKLEEYRVSGMAARSGKFPFLATRVSDGKVFKFPADTVKRALEVSK